MEDGSKWGDGERGTGSTGNEEEERRERDGVIAALRPLQSRGFVRSDDPMANC